MDKRGMPMYHVGEYGAGRYAYFDTLSDAWHYALPSKPGKEVLDLIQRPRVRAATVGQGCHGQGRHGRAGGARKGS